MIKHCLIALLVFVDICRSSSVILSGHTEANSSLADEILIVLLEKCNLQLKNIVFYDRANSTLASKVSKVVPSIGLVFETTFQSVELRNTVEFDGFVVIINSNAEWYKLISLIIFNWECSKSCTVIILSRVSNPCHRVEEIFEKVTFAHYDVVYYVCIDPTKGPRVYTHDPYGDTRPSKWQKNEIKVFSLYPWSGYYRNYDADFCHDFNFNRTNPKNDMRIMMGVLMPGQNYRKMNSYKVYKDISESPSYGNMNNTRNLERLLNTKFELVETQVQFKLSELSLIRDLWKLFPTDVQYSQKAISTKFKTYVHSNPLLRDEIVIVSHLPRYATPLEKIAQFYGIWTLISLVVILGITFVVIYLKTNRNVTSAAFDSLSLLINSGISTPINTLPLKIFFSMIFLYFMVIHATFNGNLPKFLTIPTLYNCIDTIEDLRNSPITTIYFDAHIIDAVQEMEEIREKKKIGTTFANAFLKFADNRDSVCIMSKDFAFIALDIPKYHGKGYISKNSITETQRAVAFRRRFLFHEKLNWAVTYLFEIGELNHQFRIARDKARIHAHRIKILSEINFRAISLNDLEVAFILLCVGNILALICFFIELIIGKGYHRKVNFAYSRRSKVRKFKNENKNYKIRRIQVKPRG